MFPSSSGDSFPQPSVLHQILPRWTHKNTKNPVATENSDSVVQKFLCKSFARKVEQLGPSKTTWLNPLYFCKIFFLKSDCLSLS